MATCPRCWAHLAVDHRCRRNWRRLVGTIVAIVWGAGLGAFAQLMVDSGSIPAIGAVIGAVLFSALPSIIHRIRDDRDWHRSDAMAGWSGKRRA